MYVDKKTRLIVLDFETLGTDIDNCPVLALGVVIGDTKGDIISAMEFLFPLTEQMNDSKLKIDQSTIDFWIREVNPNIIKHYITGCFGTKNSMQDVVKNIVEYFQAFLINDNYLFVGNAPEFDLALLQKLICKYSICTTMTNLFNYQQKFDFRSARYLLELANNKPTEIENYLPHDAIQDARWEYESLVSYIKTMDSQKESAKYPSDYDIPF